MSTPTIPTTVRPHRLTGLRCDGVADGRYVMRIGSARFTLTAVEVRRILAHYPLLSGSHPGLLIVANGQPDVRCVTTIRPLGSTRQPFTIARPAVPRSPISVENGYATCTCPFVVPLEEWAHHVRWHATS